ncbi:hypothetical protein C6366_09810 [Desulfonatronum sp. SC1]|nr:hypothetical protein [Desulfonatronum sp. SC1]PTN36349.1 hypothetical protein C6366_09810 [Desulfonatronum sp. SC1]
MNEFRNALRDMPPEEAARIVADVAADVFPLLSDEQRLAIIVGMTGGQGTEQGEDKVSSMVHL